MKKGEPVIADQVDRFWSKVDKSGGDSACWVWTRWLCHLGYGLAYFEGKKVKAHRLAYRLRVGEVPGGKMVCHHCDNRRCVNPAHLYVGTQRDNIRDMMVRGRNNQPSGDRHNSRTKPETVPRGSRVGTSVLTEEKVAAMRARRLEGANYKQIANEFGVGHSAAWRAASGRGWKHVPLDPAIAEHGRKAGG